MGQQNAPKNHLYLVYDNPNPIIVDDENKATSIRQCLHYLQWEAEQAGMDFLAAVIGMAALAAKDEEADD